MWTSSFKQFSLLNPCARLCYTTRLSWDWCFLGPPSLHGPSCGGGGSHGSQKDTGIRYSEVPSQRQLGVRLPHRPALWSARLPKGAVLNTADPGPRAGVCGWLHRGSSSCRHRHGTSLHPLTWWSGCLASVFTFRLCFSILASVLGRGTGSWLCAWSPLSVPDLHVASSSHVSVKSNVYDKS